jgi:hypothetical protein
MLDSILFPIPRLFWSRIRAWRFTMKHRNVRRVVLELADEILRRHPEITRDSAIEQAVEQLTKGMTLQEQMRLRAGVELKPPAP